MDPKRLERLKAQLVAKLSHSLAMYGVDKTPDEFKEMLVDRLHSMYPAFSIDELLVRPQEAIDYCKSIRRTLENFDLPDDLILRPLLSTRKNPI